MYSGAGNLVERLEVRGHRDEQSRLYTTPRREKRNKARRLMKKKKAVQLTGREHLDVEISQAAERH
jgi:hypothetical protein